MGPLPLLRADDSLLLILALQIRPTAAHPPRVWAAARNQRSALARVTGVLAHAGLAPRVLSVERA